MPDGVGNPGSGRPPFIMKPDGVASLFGPGLADGPFPEHYEPLECPVEKNLHVAPDEQPGHQAIRQERAWDRNWMSIAQLRSPFPLRLHHLPGQRTLADGRSDPLVPWLVEMQPGMFVEMSEELAKEKGIKNGEKVIVKSARGEVEAMAIVTPRFKPFNIDGNIDPPGRHSLAFRLDHHRRPDIRARTTRNPKSSPPVMRQTC